MSQPEHAIQSEIFRAIGSRADVRIFRNNTGIAWAGDVKLKFADGSIILANARPFHGGLFKGSADLIGWTSRVVTEADLGKPSGRFVSLEVKTETGRPTPEQHAWLDAVLRAGGIAGIVRSVQEAQELIR